MSIFAGVDSIVIDQFRVFGLNGKGQSSSNRIYYSEINALLKRDQGRAKDLLKEIIVGYYNNVQSTIAKAKDSKISRPGVKRGVLRCENTLSPERSLAANNSRDTEVTVERTILYAQRSRCDSGYEWFNQFNVASGVVGSSADKKTAIDLVRRRKTQPRQLDLIELKEWDSSNHPLHAALEIIRYACAYIIMGPGKSDPNNVTWPELDHAQLWLMAPCDWYKNFSRDGDVDAFMKLVHDSLESAKGEIENLQYCTFSPSLLKLTGLSKAGFYQLLKGSSGDVSHINLAEAHNAQLNKWVDESFPSVS